MFIRDKKELQCGEQIVSWLQSEGKGFLWEKEGNNYMKRRKTFLLVLKAEFCFNYTWPVTNFVLRESIIISFFVFLLALQMVVRQCWFGPVQRLFFLVQTFQRFKEQDVRCARQFLWKGCSGSIFKWLHLCQLFTFHSINCQLLGISQTHHAELCFAGPSGLLSLANKLLEGLISYHIVALKCFLNCWTHYGSLSF